MKISLKISVVAVVTAMLFTIPTTAATLNIGGTGSGGLLNFGGSNTNPSVDVLTNGTVNNGSPSGTATTNAFNTGGGPSTAALNLGRTGGPADANGTALLDLFGPGDGRNAAVALGSGNGTNGGAALDLFGTGGGSGTGGSGTGGSNDLFGPPGSPHGGLATNGIRVASLDNGGSGQCFAPDATQIARLTSRDYSQAVLSNWAAASSISVVRTNLCGGARTSIAHDANVARLQAFVAGDPALRSFLAKQGQSPADVIAVDKKGDALTLFVS